MFRVVNSMIVASMALLLVATGCSVDDRYGDGPQRYLRDTDDLNKFPVDDRRRLRDEYDRLPQGMMVRIPTDEEGRRIPEQAEARYFDKRMDFDDDSVPMHRRWGQGHDSDRIAIAHHMSHIAGHRQYHKKHRPHYHGRGLRYYDYTPYYRSAYNNYYWWNSYTYHRSYRPVGSRYEYCIYYPRYRSYSYYPRKYISYGYY